MPSKRLLEMAKKHEEKTGYKRMTAGERKKLNEKCLDKLSKIEKGDYEIRFDDMYVKKYGSSM